MKVKKKAKKKYDKEKKRISNKAWRARNRKKVSAYSKKSKALVKKKDPVGWEQKQKAWYRSYRASGKAKQTRRIYRLKKIYGLSLEQFDSMLQEQQGVCAICFCPETRRDKFGKVRELAVDHDHNTGTVRQLLCSDCNTCIGMSKESPDRLRAMAAYIERHKRQAERGAQ